MSFASLGLSTPILQALTEQGYETPSPIQLQAIPKILAGQDVMAAAQTGTGKTAGFTLPILERLSKGKRAKANQVRTLILTPTRELAAQVADSVKTYGKHLPLRANVVYGGVKINPQMMKLRGGTDILIATPGRLLDLYQQNAVRFDQLEVLVLDEADRMLDMGFIHDIRKILAVLPEKRQNLMFSATFSDKIRSLAKSIVHEPAEIAVSPRNSTATSVTQWICPVDKKEKTGLLLHLIKENNWQQVLVFMRTKHGANRLTKNLEAAKISASAIHGNKSQNARMKALADFKQGSVRILVATDIAARGLDIDQLPQIVNFDLPTVAEDYVHRIGRTGRAGATGQAVSLVSADEFDQLTDIERLIQRHLKRTFVDDFIPDHNLPESRPLGAAAKKKRPKKPKKHSAGDGRSSTTRTTKRTGQPRKRPAKAATSPSSRRSKPNQAKKSSATASKPNKRPQAKARRST